ncbi:MAG: LamG domain-containing protein, partial [Bacteroidetes bacterium]|nr:LamG domain-containing protein [Bacteroidota bacterium]
IHIIADDVSGHGHTGQPQSLLVPPNFSNTLPPPSLTVNKYGIPNEAYFFNGISDVVESSTPVFDPGKEQTQFCFYARFKGNGTGTLISSGTVGNPGTTGFELTAETTDVLFFWSDNFPGAPGTGPARFFALSSGTTPLIACKKNSWVDVAVNYSYPVLTMYINGKKVATANSELSLPGFPSPGHFGSDLLIGTNSVGINHYDNFFDSAIDEVRIYNRPLTDDEIAYLYAH